MTTEQAIAEIRANKLLAKQAKKILALVRPQIRLTPRKGKPADGKLGASRLGGEPDLPHGTEWPVGPGYDGEAPMDFIAQIDLDAVARRDVDGLLPKSGVLAFFVGQSYDSCAVIHGEHDAIERVAIPERGKKKKKPPKWGGFDVSAGMALPPPWSQLVSSTKRNAGTWNSRTGKRGKPKTLVELGPEAHEAYCDIYQRCEGEQTGMFGYERMLECVQQPDDLVLLRIDYTKFAPYDFVELCAIYWFIKPAALRDHRFDDVEVFCGSTI